MAKPIITRKRSKRPRPLEFFETLSPAVVPMAPALGKSHLDLQRYAVYLIWAAAAIAAGIGLGLLIVGTREPAAATVAPKPVATASVSVAQVPTVAAIPAAAPVVQPGLTTATATAVDQAQAGSPFAVVAATVYQPAAAPDSLQPGFQSYGRPQGNIGTAAVR